VDNGLLLKSPVQSDDKAGGAKPEEKEALTNEQANQLLKAVKGTRAYLFCLLALTTGMRRSEILGLMWEDVDFDTGYITVTHSKTLSPKRADCEVLTLLKSDAAHRRLPIPLLLRKALEEEHRASNSKFVLSMKNGESLSKCSYEALWRTVTNRTVGEGRPLGSWHHSNNGGDYTVTLDFVSHPHLLRHTFITQCFEAGMDLKQIQYLAGHSTPEMTLRVYTHFRRKAREQETADLVSEATAYLMEDEVLPKASGESVAYNGKVIAFPKG
jgi:integrase